MADAQMPGDGTAVDSASGACTSFSTQLDTCQLTLSGFLQITENALFDTDTGVLRIGGVTAGRPVRRCGRTVSASNFGAH